jgi:heat shock protein HslJ
MENSKMLRSIAVVILALLAFTLVACGGDPTPTPTAAPTAAPAEPTEPPEVEPPPATEGPVATEEPTAEPVVEPVTVEVVGEPAAASGIVNISWLWSDLVDTASNAEVTVSNPESYMLVFMADGTVNVTADCNVVLGTYAVDGNAIMI